MAKYTTDMPERLIKSYQDGANNVYRLACDLDICIDTLYDWEAKKPKFKAALNRVRTMMLADKNDRLTHPDTRNVAGLIFDLKYNHKAIEYENLRKLNQKDRELELKEKEVNDMSEFGGFTLNIVKKTEDVDDD